MLEDTLNPQVNPTSSPTPEEAYWEYRRERQEKSRRWDEFQTAIRTYASDQRIPFKGTFELTPLCSLQCKMCLMRLDARSRDAAGRELTTSEWIRMGELAFEAGTIDLLLTGGEPMLRPDFIEIYTALSDMGFLLRVFTNATLVTPQIMALFEERPPQNIEVSVYGASRETYERIGGWAEGYDRMVAGVDALRQCVPSIKLKTMLVRDNAADFADMHAFAFERGMPLMTSSIPMPAIRGARADVRACRMNLQELLTFHAKHGLNFLNESCAPPSLENRSAIYCDAGLSSYAVLWNGAMVACMTDNDPKCIKGYPLAEGFDTVWERLENFRHDKPLPEPCKTCPAYAVCSTCGTHHYAETGAYDKHTQYGCDFYRIQHGLPVLWE